MFFKSLFNILIVCYMIDFSYGQNDTKFFRKDYHYIEVTKSFYKVNSIPRNFDDAKRLCALEGASLFYPENQQEADAVISYWNSTYPTWWSVVLGINDLVVNGVFETIDGKPISEVYHNWGLGEPNDEGGEDCVIIYSDGLLTDVSCKNKYPFVCKKSLQSIVWDQQCNMPNLGYSYNEKTDSCYKLHTSPLNWTEAYLVCKAEQSYLAIPDSMVEADILAQLTVTASRARVAQSYQRGIYHMGFHNRFPEGWRTIKAGTVSNENGIWWRNYQPEEGNQDQCGSMFFNGQLNQINCDVKSFFICEHDVEMPNMNLAQTTQ